MIVLVDRGGAFTNGLYQKLGVLDADVRIVDAAQTDAGALARLYPTHIVFAPGSYAEDPADLCGEIVRQLGPTVPVLGIGPGHLGIVRALGGSVLPLRNPVIGQASSVGVQGDDPLFAGLGPTFEVGRYDALGVDPGSLPDSLVVTARSSDHVVQAVRHRDWPLHGLAFHPESVLTPRGGAIVANFVRLAAR